MPGILYAPLRYEGACQLVGTLMGWRVPQPVEEPLSDDIETLKAMLVVQRQALRQVVSRIFRTFWSVGCSG